MIAESALEPTGRSAVGDKTPARQRLIEAAETLFADHGWTAVSIRTIVAAADVNLAALHYHFGSKEKLLEEIFAARAKPIAEERLRRLAELKQGPKAATLEDVLDAFLRPALALGVDPKYGGPAFVKLRARLATAPGDVSRDILRNAFDESSRPFVDEIHRALPGARRRDVEWGFHFLLGTMVYTMANPGRIQSLTAGACDPGDVDAALDHLIPFLAAGFRGSPPEKRRRS